MNSLKPNETMFYDVSWMECKFFHFELGNFASQWTVRIIKHLVNTLWLESSFEFVTILGKVLQRWKMPTFSIKKTFTLRPPGEGEAHSSSQLCHIIFSAMVFFLKVILKKIRFMFISQIWDTKSLSNSSTLSRKETHFYLCAVVSFN